MDPNQQPSPYNPQYNNAPAPVQPPAPPVAPGNLPQPSATPPSASPGPPPKKNRLPFIIAGVIIGLLVIVTLVGIFTGKSQAPSPKQSSSTPVTSESSFLKPATAIGVEQTSNSISQDLSGLNDDTDFPKNKLDDKSLGL